MLSVNPADYRLGGLLLFYSKETSLHPANISGVSRRSPRNKEFTRSPECKTSWGCFLGVPHPVGEVVLMQ